MRVQLHCIVASSATFTQGFVTSANQDVKCLSETSWLWHRRLGHMHMEHLKDISSKELVRGLPKMKFEKDKVTECMRLAAGWRDSGFEDHLKGFLEA
ncbi:hypothetical protein RJ640_029230 [Escallonia rubra]|uniref:GAG-pre-integrase domain-containing protein n=1 Tax=Escallonia rubra TaxID=112253 RepID=A0AA88R4I1_9ASTE|nr:hypothetical protein RJ640_029230 [Escallonia rubra]